jgi:hypothetical protein
VTWPASSDVHVVLACEWYRRPKASVNRLSFRKVLMASRLGFSCHNCRLMEAAVDPITSWSQSQQTPMAIWQHARCTRLPVVPSLLLAASHRTIQLQMRDRACSAKKLQPGPCPLFYSASLFSRECRKQWRRPCRRYGTTTDLTSVRQTHNTTIPAVVSTRRARGKPTREEEPQPAIVVLGRRVLVCVRAIPDRQFQ